MSAQEYIDEWKNFQSLLLVYIDKENDVEINFQDLENQMGILKVFENQYKLKIIINLIIKIANNHHRGPNFFLKIEKNPSNSQRKHHKIFYKYGHFFTIQKQQKSFSFLN